MEKNYKKYKSLVKRQYTTFMKSGIYINSYYLSREVLGNVCMYVEVCICEELVMEYSKISELSWMPTMYDRCSLLI